MSDYDPEDLYETSDLYDVQEWLDGVMDAVAELEYEPTAWEVDFLESIGDRLDSWIERNANKVPEELQPLTGKQLVSLRQIYDKVNR